MSDVPGVDPRRQIELRPEDLEDPQAIHDAITDRELELLIEDQDPAS